MEASQIYQTLTEILMQLPSLLTMSALIIVALILLVAAAFSERTPKLT